MPLVPCPDCHRPISDAAPACVHCGRPAPRAVPASHAAPEISSPRRRRHPLAGADAPPAARTVLRAAVAAVAVVLVVVSWFRGDGMEWADDLLSALISLGFGVSLLLMPVPEPPARTPGTRRRRGNWGEWFDQQDRRREFRWNRVAGWVLVAIGALYLLMAAM